MGINQVFILYVIGCVPRYWCFALSSCACSALDPTVLLDLKEVSMPKEGGLWSSANTPHAWGFFPVRQEMVTRCVT